MRNVGALKLVPVWVNPNHLVDSARILLKGHGLRALAVMCEGRLLGLVSRDRLASAPGHDAVEHHMEPVVAAFDADTPTRQVSREFVELGLEYAPVIRGGEFAGIVTANLLLQELGRSFDPLTELSWSDHLREWGVEELKEGNEITILFIDLDEFGQFNKRYGHVVGDKVLRAVAATLQTKMASEDGVLVRYGGDEFAVGLRKRFSEASDTARSLADSIRSLQIEGVPEQIACCIGIYGGRRTRERENVHFAATLDNLINLASQDCIRQKRPGEAISDASSAVPAPPADGPFRVEAIQADDSPYSIVEVQISSGDQTASGVNARSGRPLQEAVASATARALEKLHSARRIQLLKVELRDDGVGGTVAGIEATLEEGQNSLVVNEEVKVVGGEAEAVAAAVVKAFSRGS